jgi:hypothetical protein
MRRLAIALLSVLSGCADLGIAMSGPAETGSLAPLSVPAETQAPPLSQPQRRALDDVRRPMRTFLAEREPNCNSAKLKEAKLKATETAGGMAAAMKPDYQVMVEAALAVLDVADAARTKGCAAVASELYQYVLKNYSGLGYATVRERAAAGIRGLPAKA